jgi:hypothetical protein
MGLFENAGGPPATLMLPAAPAAPAVPPAPPSAGEPACDCPPPCAAPPDPADVLALPAAPPGTIGAPAEPAALGAVPPIPAGMPGGLSKPHAKASAAPPHRTVQEVQEAYNRLFIDSKRIMVSRPKTLLRLLNVRSIVDRSRRVRDSAYLSAAIQAEHISL